MFTGIVECTGRIADLQKEENNIHYTLSSPISDTLHVDQSVAHEGCCLTITEAGKGCHKVTAIAESISKTTLGNWKIGMEINLERCLAMNGRLDGHIVQGHVDCKGKVLSIQEAGGSHVLEIEHPHGESFYTVPRGSITVNGISLTVAESNKNSFKIAIIPYTWEHTSIKNLCVNDEVNLEFDIVGKYVARLMQLQNEA